MNNWLFKIVIDYRNCIDYWKCITSYNEKFVLMNKNVFFWISKKGLKNVYKYNIFVLKIVLSTFLVLPSMYY